MNKKIILLTVVIGMMVVACTGTKAPEAKPFTSTHVFTAVFQGSHFHTCMGLTSLCPDECGSSGEMADFYVKEYKHFIVNGKSGTKKIETYHVLITDYYKTELDKPYVADIKRLEKGDLVRIHVEYVYDTTLDVVQPVENLISIKKI